MGRFEGFCEGVSVGLDVGGKVGHSLQPAQTVNPHLISQEAGLEKQNASQSHTQLSVEKFFTRAPRTVLIILKLFTKILIHPMAYGFIIQCEYKIKRSCL